METNENKLRDLEVTIDCNFCDGSFKLLLNKSDYIDYMTPPGTSGNLDEIFPYLSHAELARFEHGMCEDCQPRMDDTEYDENGMDSFDF